MEITKQIKTYQDACKVLGIDPDALPVVTALAEKDQKYVIANYKLIIIARALNEGWEPNFNNDNEYKYYPWFEVQADQERPAGFGFSLTYYVRWNSGTGVGSRLCFKSRDLALYAAKQFEDLYLEQLLILG